MYGWLAEAVDGSACVLTSSRRLARTLAEHFGLQQVERGRRAWKTPDIYFWQDWLRVAISELIGGDVLPVRISSNQSRVVWERCLARTIGEPLFGRGILLREVQETWTRLQEWQVTVDACEKSARSRDHFAFVRAARSYAAALAAGNWVDPAGLAGLGTSLIREDRMICPRRVYAAGFDRLVPQVAALFDAMRATGSDVSLPDAAAAPRLDEVYVYESPEAELRAAGSWARSCFEGRGSARLAVIVPDLAQHAEAAGRLVREGLVPGWQNGGSSLKQAVNVSFGKPLLRFPAIRVASLILRWLHSDIASADVSVLLCSQLLGAGTVDGRCRLESGLRQRPGQNWSPEGLAAVLDRGEPAADVAPWFAALRRLADTRATAPHVASPAAWASTFDAVLGAFGWPGTHSPGSHGFQLVNRWRELLNEFSQLAIVQRSMDAPEAQRRLEAMAMETLFQPEATEPLVQVLGPLEAAGLEFDGVWLARMSAANWPPGGRPLALVSRELQREYGMPDADPEDTLRYGERVLDRLLASGNRVVVSYATHTGDAEQTLCGLVGRVGIAAGAGPPDPGWHACRLLDHVPLGNADADPVPGVTADEAIAGGAATLQHQLTDPFSAFVRGRLGVRLLIPLSDGLTSRLRGNLIHDALRYLYAELPDAGALDTWRGKQLDKKAGAAIERAFLRYSMHADPLLQKLLQLEAKRTAGLVSRIVALDRARGGFTVAAVESPLDAVIEGVRLKLRVDRVDELSHGELLIWDYKTGQPRKFLGRDGDPADYQPVVYSCALTGRVAGIGLYNIDSRAVAVDFAGVETMPGKEWDAALARWQSLVRGAAREFAAGDVRINRRQPAAGPRAFAILGRHREIVDGS